MIRTQKKSTRLRPTPVRIGTLLAVLALTACGGGGDGGGGGFSFIPPAAGGGGGGAGGGGGGTTPTDPSGPGNPPPVDATLRIGVLSSSPQLVTGDDALVELELLREKADGSLTVSVDGRDVTAAFSRDPASGRLVGKVTGLKLGSNEL